MADDTFLMANDCCVIMSVTQKKADIPPVKDGNAAAKD